MSFTSKANVREYSNRPNSYSNKVQGYRNSSENTQYNDGESFSYEDKRSHNSSSPKNFSENQGLPQQNSSSREYPYKNSNNRPKQFNYHKNFNEKSFHYYNQQSNTHEDFIVPEIDNLRAFVYQQTERFKTELSYYENESSNSPSIGSNQYQDQVNYRHNKQYSSNGRSDKDHSSLHSMGSLGSGSTVHVDTTLSPQCPDNSSHHPDARMAKSPFVVKSNNGYSYNKHSPQGTGSKSSHRLPRNLSHEETHSIINKNSIECPGNNVEKVEINKTQLPSPTGSAGGRHDFKKGPGRTKQHNFVSGAAVQTNQDNATTPNHGMTNEVRRNEPQPRPTMSAVVRNGCTNRRCKDGESEVPSYRAVVSVADSSRRLSHSGSTTDSQDVVDTPTIAEQFFTPDPPASPCSTHSSPDPTRGQTFRVVNKELIGPSQIY